MQGKSREFTAPQPRLIDAPNQSAIVQLARRAKSALRTVKLRGATRISIANRFLVGAIYFGEFARSSQRADPTMGALSRTPIAHTRRAALGSRSRARVKLDGLIPSQLPPANSRESALGKKGFQLGAAEFSVAGGPPFARPRVMAECRWPFPQSMAEDRLAKKPVRFEVLPKR